jgi:hypothetical protein
MTDLFSPAYGLFCFTAAEKDYYPNPATHCIPDFLELMRFAGRIVRARLYPCVCVRVYVRACVYVC